MIADTKALRAVVLEVIGPRLLAAGLSPETVDPKSNLIEIGVLDSFSILEAMMEIEEKAGVSADLAAMDFDLAMTVDGLVAEIVRLNS